MLSMGELDEALALGKDEQPLVLLFVAVGADGEGRVENDRVEYVRRDAFDALVAALDEVLRERADGSAGEALRRAWPIMLAVDVESTRMLADLP